MKKNKKKEKPTKVQKRNWVIMVWNNFEVLIRIFNTRDASVEAKARKMQEEVAKNYGPEGDFEIDDPRWQAWESQGDIEGHLTVGVAHENEKPFYINT